MTRAFWLRHTTGPQAPNTATGESNFIPLMSSRAAASAAAIIGIIALLGWVVDSGALKSIIPGAVEMKANTAIGILLASASLYIASISRTERSLRLGWWLGITTLLIGVLTAVEYAANWNLGIDELLFKDTANAYNAIRGRMSPFSAAVFTVLGGTLAFLHRETPRLTTRLLGSLIVTAIGAISLVGYIWNATEIVTDVWAPPVAINTAVAFLLLGLGCLRISFNLAGREASASAMEIKILLGFGAALLVTIFTGAMTYRTIARLEHSASMVEHTQEVRAEIGHVYSTLSDLESSQRSYILTGLPLYKRELEIFATEFRNDEARLSSMVADNPAQSANLGDLRRYSEHRISNLYKHLAVFEKVGLEATKQSISQDDGIDTMRTIRLLVDKMDAVERQLLVSRQAELDRWRSSTFVSLIVLLALSTLLLSALFLAIRRESIARAVTEHELQAAAARIATILETVDDGIVTFNDGGTIESANPAFDKLFGYLPGQSRGKQLSSLIPAFGGNEYDPDDDEHDLAGFRKDGTSFPLEMSLGEMMLDGRRYFTGVVHDLTRRNKAADLLRQSKDKAERASQAKDSFLATMSHEIRTPLTGLLGMLELLSMSGLDASQRRTLDIAWTSGRSLLRIVNDVLDWSRIEEGKLELAPQPISIAAILQDVANTYSRVASAKGLILTQSSDPGISSALMADPLRIAQILNNFVSNAIKFTAKGRVDIRSQLVARADHEETICLSVSDTGPGIASEFLTELFQRYRQESVHTARMYGGTGLGLSICRRLAELQGGEISVESESGVGSVFKLTITLPTTDAEVSTQSAIRPDPDWGSVAPMYENSVDSPLILAVDDHPINRDLLASQLKRLGLRVMIAAGGKEALRCWQENDFALVITDCHMPELDGYDLARQIRAQELVSARNRTPIVAWTANALSSEAERCTNAGMDDMLVKPTTIPTLRALLARWLEIPDPLLQSGINERATSYSETNDAPIDFEILNQVVVNPAERERILERFLTHLRADGARIRELVAAGGSQEIAAAAHRLKGACSAVGAMALASACASIEKAGYENNSELLRDAARQLASEMEKFEHYLIEIRNTD